MAPVLTSLRNIGTFRTGPLWSGTRNLPNVYHKDLVESSGDPATFGFFLDEKDILYFLVVDGNPCTWAKLHLNVHTAKENDKLFLFNINDSAFRELWPADIHNQLLTLAPGEGRLFKVGSEGLGVNF